MFHTGISAVSCSLYGVNGSPDEKRHLVPNSQFFLNFLPAVREIMCLASHDDGAYCWLTSLNWLYPIV